MKQNKTILLVEDEVLIAMKEADMLKKHGYNVLTAGSAKNAIETVNEGDVDLVLMDIDLGKGKMDGTEAAEIILRDRELPIIFLTSHREKEVVDKVKGITRYGYVIKTSGEFIIKQSIDTAFELFEAHRKLQLEIRERKKEEKQRAIYKQAINSSKDFIVAIDTGYRYLFANTAFLKRYGKKEEEVVGKHMEEVLDANLFNKSLKPQLERVLKGGFVEFDLPITYRDGVELELRIEYYPLREDYSVTGVVCIAKDVTEERRAQDALVESEANLKAVMDNTEDIIVLCDPDCRALFYNSAYEKYIKEHFSADARPGSRAIDYLRGKEREELQGIVNDVLKGKRVRKESQYTVGDQQKIFDIVFNPISKNRDVIGFSEIARDITEYKKIERELRRYQEQIETILNSIPADIYIADIEGFNILFMNQEMKRSFPEARVGDTCYKVFRGADDPCPHCTNNKLLEDENRRNNLITWEGKNPINGRWYLNYDRVIPWSGDRLARMQIAVDITDRKVNEERLKTTAEEKDFLMKELNHRVKNNLVMVSSLISLKNSTLGDEVDLTDLEHQIDAIRIVHEKLYKTEEVTRLNLKEYVQELLDSVFSSSVNSRVSINFSAKTDLIPTKTGISLGLIINEIATNAVKHGFKEGDWPDFSVSVETDGEKNEHIVTLSNSGEPFPEGINFDNPETLGLRLVTALVEQISGTIELKRKPHPVFTIRFPAGETNGR